MAKSRIRKVGTLVNQLMARRGYAQVAATEQMHAVIASSVGGQLAAGVRVGNLRGGVLQLFASDSVTLQELNFQKRTILRAIRSQFPDAGIDDLRFRIQS